MGDAYGSVALIGQIRPPVAAARKAALITQGDNPV